MAAATVGGAVAAEELGAAGGEGLAALGGEAAAAGELGGAAGGFLEDVNEGGEDIDSGGVFEGAFVGLFEFEGLVKLGDEAGDVGVVFGGGDDEDLIEACVGDDLGGDGGDFGGFTVHLLDTALGGRGFVFFAVFAIAFAVGTGGAAEGGDAFGFLFLGLGGDGGLNDLGDDGGVGVFEGDEFGDEVGSGGGAVDGVFDADELADDGGAFGDEESWRGGDGGHAAVDGEADVVGEDGGGVFGDEVVEGHEVGDEGLTFWNIGGGLIEGDAVGELDGGCALGAGGEDTGAGATGIDDDGVAVGEESGFDEADGFAFFDGDGGDEADGGALEDAGVFDEGHGGEALVDVEEIFDGVVGELEFHFIAIDDHGFDAVLTDSGAHAATGAEATAAGAAEAGAITAGAEAATGAARA